MPLFFISYKREDLEFALKIKEFIESISDGEYLCWIDREGLNAGDKWKLAIDSAINQSIGVILIITPESLKSLYVTYEWSFAMGMGKRIIPLIHRMPNEKEMHPKLADLHMLFFNTTDESSHEWSDLKRELLEVKERHDVPPAILNMRQIIYDNIFDKEVWQTMLDTIEQFEHPAASEMLVEFMEAGLPSLMIESTRALARKSEFTDMRVLPYLQRGIIENRQREVCAKILAMYPSGDVIEILQDMLDYFYDFERAKYVQIWTEQASLELLFEYSDYLYKELMNEWDMTVWTKFHGKLLEEFQADYLQDLYDFFVDPNVKQLNIINQSFEASIVNCIYNHYTQKSKRAEIDARTKLILQAFIEIQVIWKHRFRQLQTIKSILKI